GSWASKVDSASRSAGSSSASRTRTCALPPRGRGALTGGDASIPAGGATAPGRGTVKHVVAMGGGGWMMEDPALDRAVLELTHARRPRICFLPTASGDDPGSARFLEAFPSAGFDASILWLFDRDVADIDVFLGEQDVVYVGGGNTVSMLAVWRAHGVDRALRAASAAGVVIAGMGAGGNCWLEDSTTDSFRLGPAGPLPDGLGFAP